MEWPRPKPRRSGRHCYRLLSGNRDGSWVNSLSFVVCVGKCTGSLLCVTNITGCLAGGNGVSLNWPCTVFTNEGGSYEEKNAADRIDGNPVNPSPACPGEDSLGHGPATGADRFSGPQSSASIITKIYNYTVNFFFF